MLRWGDSVVGLDCSTKSIAYCKIEGGDVTDYDEIALFGADAFSRIRSAKNAMAELGLKADHVAIEGAIYVNNMKASINLAYVYGAVLSELMTDNSTVFTVTPTQWQAHIGNKQWTKAERSALAAEYPDKTATWVKNEIRKRRKQFTLDWVDDEYGILLDSDNIGDAFGLARYVWDTYTDGS